MCVHNSARSQMAEAFLNQLAGDKFEAESAGISPGILNPFVVKAMKEHGLFPTLHLLSKVMTNKKKKLYSTT